MPQHTPDPIVSGVPYRIVDVDGRPPTSLVDFDGGVTMTVGGSTGEHRVCGEGAAHDHDARVHEKADGSGRDVRTWLVRSEGDAGFTATTV